MTRQWRRLRAVAATASVAAVLLTGCSYPEPLSPVTEDTTMTIAEGYQEVLDILDAVRSAVAEDGWGEDNWYWSFRGPREDRISQYNHLSSRRLPLPATPDEVAARVVRALDGIGYPGAKVEHDTQLSPVRTVIAYPAGYLRGSGPDGFLIEFQAYESYADVYVHGRFVPGASPKLGTPLNPRPTDFPS